MGQDFRVIKKFTLNKNTTRCRIISRYMLPTHSTPNAKSGDTYENFTTYDLKA
jgi:hypothetical protein